VVYSDEECERVISLYHQRFPAIRQWHNEVRERVRKDKKLVNSWGRVWPVEFMPISAELFRKAYSYYLQSDIAGWLNIWGFRDCYYWLQKNKMQSRIMLQEHDGLVLSCAPDEVYDVAVFLRDNLEQPWMCDGQEMWVPVEFQLGTCWGQGVEWSELPSREEFDRCLLQLLVVSLQ
jgi:DNA polymerase I-like protein with 3'-5' exonuclease and polymerase domains